MGNLAHALNDLGNRYGELPQLEDALASYLETVDILRRLAPVNRAPPPAFWQAPSTTWSRSSANWR